MLTFAIACAAFCATFAGGLFALWLKDKLHLVLGFSAGAVIGVAFFDLLPEAIDLGQPFHSPEAIMSWAALGFLIYLALDRIQFFHAQRHHHHHRHDHHHHAHDHAHHHESAGHPADHILPNKIRGTLGASLSLIHI